MDVLIKFNHLKESLSPDFFQIIPTLWRHINKKNKNDDGTTGQSKGYLS